MVLNDLDRLNSNWFLLWFLQFSSSAGKHSETTPSVVDIQKFQILRCLIFLVHGFKHCGWFLSLSALFWMFLAPIKNSHPENAQSWACRAQFEDITTRIGTASALVNMKVAIYCTGGTGPDKVSPISQRGVPSPITIGDTLLELHRWAPR